ncbi:MAG: hypothetical protein KatS3mg102_1115 [Planctomycetota bacterium]|nr:MAG: hypothetical protein KatS3mg102_1115 [Planctomycetota bacterium]
MYNTGSKKLKVNSSSLGSYSASGGWVFVKLHAFKKRLVVEFELKFEGGTLSGNASAVE